MERLKTVKSWLERAGLTLIDEKMEAILITNSRKRNDFKVKIVGHTVVSNLAVKYMITDVKINFIEYPEYPF